MRGGGTWDCKHLCILFVQKLGASGVAVGEVRSFDGVVF